MSILIDKNIIKKYDVSGPRYTSYPTAPQWTGKVAQTEYIQKLKDFAQTDKTLSLYFHIPFCQSMCTYCGCNVVIRKQEERFGDEYCIYLEKEIDLILDVIGSGRRVKQLHWGGGTPTFLSGSQIEKLFEKIDKSFKVDRAGEVAIEIDPRTIDFEKLKILKSVGFNRISMGVQDFNLKVQESINRIQPYELVAQSHEWCRSLGFGSVNFDLIYGLPHQTKNSFMKTVQQVIDLKPDRIALYSFAYVPWLKKHQNKIDQQSLPDQDMKLSIFLNAREQFLDSDYQAIAMDHFALKTDELSRAYDNNCLYRNFMGYTVKPADEYIGFGVSSIGYLQSTFIQNAKALPAYYQFLDEGKLPVERGLILSEDDQIRQWTINSLMCHFRLNVVQFEQKFGHKFMEYYGIEQGHLQNCMDDGLLTFDSDEYRVTELGKIFVRNICMGFDYYLGDPNKKVEYSRTI